MKKVLYADEIKEATPGAGVVIKELQALPASLFMRAQSSVIATGAAGQVISFTSQFVTTYALQIIDYEGLGIDIIAQDENGFTITPGSAGTFSYIALIEQ